MRVVGACLALLLACGGSVSLVDQEREGGAGGSISNATSSGGGFASSSVTVGVGGGSGAGPPATPCPQPDEFSGEACDSLPLILESSELGDGVELVGIDHNFVVAHRAPGSTQGRVFVARVEGFDSNFPSEIQLSELEPPPPPDAVAIDIDVTHHFIHVLACAGVSCSVYGGSPGGDSLTLVAGAVPIANPRGVTLAIAGEDAAPRLCVFGDGVACRKEAGFAVVEAPGPKGDFLEGVGGEAIWLVGEQGRLARLDLDGGLEELVTGTVATLRDVVAAHHETIAVGDDGVVVVAGKTLESCPQLDEDLYGVGRYWDPGYDVLALFGGSGTLRVRSVHGACTLIIPAADPVAFSSYACGIGFNLLMLSATGLWGYAACPIGVGPPRGGL